jgi:serine/threonine protein kinase
VAAVLALAAQLAQALAAAHAQGVIHRDIKPQNLLLDERGILKVMDFGVSRLADSAGGVREAGLLIGTPAYMAPEQLLGDDVDERTDLYATGVVLFECLTGRLPFEAESPVEAVLRRGAAAAAGPDRLSRKAFFSTGAASWKATARSSGCAQEPPYRRVGEQASSGDGGHSRPRR